MSARKRALGRGLDSLLGAPPKAKGAAKEPSPADVAPEAAEDRRVLEIPVTDIRPNPHQPRTEFHEEAIAELAESIAEKGVLQPLLVRKRHGGYELVAGERRFRASSKAGLEKVPCIVVQVSDAESFEIALIENLQREDLNALEEARAFRALIEDFELTQEEAAKRVGRSRPAVANSLRLLQLPADIQEDLLEDRLTAGHARAILSVTGDAKQRRLRNEIVAKALSVRQAEQAAQKLETGEAAKKVKKPNEVDPQLQTLQDAFSTRLGMHVAIQPSSRKAGRVVIRYKSLDDFENLTNFFGIET